MRSLEQPKRRTNNERKTNNSFRLDLVWLFSAVSFATCFTKLPGRRGALIRTRPRCRRTNDERDVRVFAKVLGIAGALSPVVCNVTSQIS